MNKLENSQLAEQLKDLATGYDIEVITQSPKRRPEIDGIILNGEYQGATGCFIGNVVGDRKNHFRDGEFIRTSKVERVIKDALVIVTRNSVYLAMPPAPEQKMIDR